MYSLILAFRYHSLHETVKMNQREGYLAIVDYKNIKKVNLHELHHKKRTLILSTNTIFMSFIQSIFYVQECLITLLFFVMFITENGQKIQYNTSVYNYLT